LRYIFSNLKDVKIRKIHVIKFQDAGDNFDLNYIGTPASSTTKTGRHDIAEILLKVALSTIN
jgi:hypothetical protein